MRLEGLTIEQWSVQSLCDEWKVRHVVAHLVDSVAIGGFDLVRGVIRSIYEFNKVRAEAALSRGDKPPERLLAEFRSTIGVHPRRPIPRLFDMLVDTAIHVHDIRRPLGMGYAFPPDTAIVVADQLAKTNLVFGAKKRIRGLRFVADDVTWSRGDGPEVRGRIEAMIMVMAGRSVPAGEFAGDGAAALAPRVRLPYEMS
ncbi:MAG: maleylpyruvate isomerase family mycothiol-dependent enzyme [Actinomycetota bacterium]|nr:maleylpyruvate isomerase family mycothiol-dependent enzyme [Actinomycetota bacterium]